MTGGTGFDGFRNHGPRETCVNWGKLTLSDNIYLDSLGIKLETFFLVGEELLNILALISLKLNHLSHFSIDNDGAIASCR